jgi:hypothetical protein
VLHSLRGVEMFTTPVLRRQLALVHVEPFVDSLQFALPVHDMKPRHLQQLGVGYLCELPFAAMCVKKIKQS